MKKFLPGKVLGSAVFSCGIATASIAAVKNHQGLRACRIFLGIFEAAIVPTLILALSLWYTKSERTVRLAICYCGLPVGQTLGSLSSFGFQHVVLPEFESWRIMFVAFGGITMIVGVATFFCIPDGPSTARFLSEAEKKLIVRHLSRHTTAEADNKSSRKAMVEALKSLQLVFLVFMNALVRVCKIITYTVPLTLIAARPFLRRYQHFLIPADHKFWILAQTSRAPQRTFWFGLDGKYPHRWFRCTPHLKPLAVVHCHMHSGCNWCCTDELLAE